MKKSSASKSMKKSGHIIYKDAGGCLITNKLLEKILKEAKRVKKNPLLIIRINRNEKQWFVINCDISIEKK